MDPAKNLKVESVSRLNPSPPWKIRPGQTVAEAAALMREKVVGCLLVCDQDQLVGIFTERDLLRRVLSQGQPLTTPVANFMTSAPVTVHPKDSIGTAIKRMQTGGYRHLPVVVDGQPVGILSVRRIIHYLVEHFPEAVYNLPPDPDAIQHEREGA